MLHYAVVFLVIALIAALFGFGGVVDGTANIGRVLFAVFGTLTLVSLLLGLLKNSAGRA